MKISNPWLATFCVCLCLALALRLELILGRGSYPGHFDEAFLARKALRMLQSGDPNPQWFRYGSLPMYLTSAGMAVGAQLEQAQGSLSSIHDVSSVSDPYFSHPLTMTLPKALFALLSALGLMSAGLLARSLWRRPESPLVAVVALSCSALYLKHSWTYLNVDIVAASLSLMALAFFAHTASSGRVIDRAVIPALFCGAVVASKYNSGLIGLPFLIAALQARRWLHVALLLALSLLAFFLFQPFAFIEFPRFVADLRHEMQHYARGHRGYDGEPGIAQLVFYARSFGDDVGWALAVCVLFGIRRSLLENRRTALLVLSFPVSLVLYMSLQRVNFVRNVLPAFSVLAVFAGLGVLELSSLAAHRLQSLLQMRGARTAWSQRLAVALVVGLTCGPGLYKSARLAAQPISESRLHVGRWLDAHAKGRCQVVIPQQLVIDVRDLKRCVVTRVDIADEGAAQRIRMGDHDFSERYALPATFVETSRSNRDRNEAWLKLIEDSSLVLQTGRAKLVLDRDLRRKSPTNPRLQLYRLSQLDVVP